MPTIRDGLEKSVKAELDRTEKDHAREVVIDAEFDGDVELHADLPITKAPKGLGWLNGGTFTTYVQTKVQRLKETAGGFRVRKKW
jgi:hypothetical protein